MTKEQLIEQLKLYPDGMEVRMEINRRSDVCPLLTDVYTEHSSAADGSDAYILLAYS